MTSFSLRNWIMRFQNERTLLGSSTWLSTLHLVWSGLSIIHGSPVVKPPCFCELHCIGDRALSRALL